ncbi:MAG: hypothetical protein PHW34_11630 [Hespellia sp.]|nr:hypothetical protein [Hespellia sp.]
MFKDIGAFDIIAIILVVDGILNLFGIMMPFKASMTKKYTPESIKAWIRPMGIASIIMGIGCELADLSVFANNSNFPGWFTPVGFGLIAVGAIMGLTFNKIFLKKIK